MKKREKSSNGKIEFIYDATGNKCRKTVDSTGISNYRDYINGVEYYNGQQDIIHFTEGYAQRDATKDNDPNWRGWVVGGHGLGTVTTAVSDTASCYCY